MHKMLELKNRSARKEVKLTMVLPHNLRLKAEKNTAIIFTIHRVIQSAAPLYSFCNEYEILDIDNNDQ